MVVFLQSLMGLLVRDVGQNLLGHEDVFAVKHLAALTRAGLLLLKHLLFFLDRFCHRLKSAVTGTLLALGWHPVLVKCRLIFDSVC